MPEENWVNDDLLKLIADPIAGAIKEGRDNAVRAAVQAEREACAEIAHNHGNFCFDEADKGGSPDLRERAKGAFHIAKKIMERR